MFDSAGEGDVPGHRFVLGVTTGQDATSSFCNRVILQSGR